MRFLMVATVAVLGLLAPTEAMTIQEKLQSLSARVSLDALVQGGCGALKSDTCASESNCHWVTEYNACLQKTGHACHAYTTPHGCQQHGNPCVWHEEKGSKAKCIDAPVQDTCGKSATSTACGSNNECRWLSSSKLCVQKPGLECDHYVTNNGCTQPGNKCKWYKTEKDPTGKCIKGPGLECHSYSSEIGCEQNGNQDKCLYYHHGKESACLSKDLLYEKKTYVFDCSGTHSSTTGHDSKKKRNKQQCDQQPVKDYCRWDDTTKQCEPKPATHKPKPATHKKE